MLWALAILGLVPAAFAVTDAIGADDSDEEEQMPDETSSDEPTGDLLDDAASQSDTSDDTTDTETDSYEISLGSGETVIDDFQPGTDSVQLTLDDGGAGEFIIESMQDEGGEDAGISLSYDDGEEETTLSFPGLTEIPTDDISVNIVDGETGEATTYALSELGDFGAILPNDPEEPDEAGPVGDPSDNVIEPNDPEEPDEPGPVGSDEDNVILPETPTETATGTPTGETVTHALSDDGEVFVLADDAMQGGTDAELALDETGQPTIETEGTLNIVEGGAGDDQIAAGDDAAIINAGGGNDIVYGGDGTAILSGGDGDDTIYAGNDLGSSYVLSGDEGADTLIGGDGDDSLLIDAEDTATGGEGADEFWLYFDASADVGHAEITDFDTGEDILRVTLNPDADFSGTLEPSVQLSEDGLSTEVVVNGAVVAVLQGNTSATLDDILVEVVPAS